MNIYLWGVITSILIYLLVGFYAGRKVKNVEDYYVSGRNASTFLITGTMFASMLSINGFMGDTAYAYSGYITSIVLINTICASGYVIGPLFFGRFIRRAKVNTMPSYFFKRFNSIRIKRFAGVVTVISLSAYFLSVIKGTSILMQSLTGFNETIALLLSWGCIMIFTLYSGSKGVILTDTIMCIFFLSVTIVAGSYVFNSTGGVSNLVTNLVNNPLAPDGMLSYKGIDNNSLFYAITMGIIWMITVSVSPWQAGRNLMAKNEHVIFRSGVLTALITVLFLFYLYLIAISIIQINPNMQKPEEVIIWAAYKAMPEIVGMLLLTGIMAAGLSSASTFLSVVSFSISSDILDIKFKNEKKQLNFTRIVLFIFSIIILIIAHYNILSIRVLAWFASTIIAASWGYVAFASVWSKKLTERGAYYAMISGFLTFIIARFLKEYFDIPLENFLHPFFIATFVSILSGILGSQNQIKTKEEIKFQIFLHILPKKESNILDYKKDKIFAWIIIISGIIISILLINYWAFAYEDAINLKLSMKS